MINYHRVTAGQFEQLASGSGGAPVIHDLAATQLSKNLLLLRFITTQWPEERTPRDSAISVLARAQRRDPRKFADLMADPLVGAWAAWTTRRLRGTVGSAVPLAADLGHLGAVAAVAALRTGIDAELHTYSRGGRVTLPGLGDAMVFSNGAATITVSGGLATVSGHGAPAVTVSSDDPGWLGLRRLSAGDGRLACSLTVEDGNPYRDCYHAPAAIRLASAEVRRWQSLFADAWELLCQFLPERAAEISAGLHTLVPLAADGSGTARSGTARDAPGALGLTRPRSAVEMAITLVHELQHSKLSALLDIVPLYVAGGNERHFAPWRTDARPTGGLIQGVYAFLGVADAWRGLRGAFGLEERATREFATVREQVRVGLAALETSAELTPAGRRFATGLRGALYRLLAEQVPASAVRDASDTLRRRKHAWDSAHPGLIATGNRLPSDGAG